MKKRQIVAISLGMMLAVTSCSGGDNSISESTPKVTGGKVTSAPDKKETKAPDSSETPDSSIAPQETNSAVSEPMPTSGKRDGRYFYVDDNFGFQMSFPYYTINRMEGTAFCVQYKERENAKGKHVLDKFMAVDKYYDGKISTGKDQGKENIKTVKDVLENQKFKIGDAWIGVTGGEIKEYNLTQEEPVSINGYDMCKFSGTLTEEIVTVETFQIVGYTILAQGEPIIIFAIDTTEDQSQIQDLTNELETVIQSFQYPENGATDN